MRVRNRQELQDLLFGGEDISTRSWPDLLAAVLEKKQEWQKKFSATLPSPARRMLQRTLQQCDEAEQFTRLEAAFDELKTTRSENKRRGAELAYAKLKALLEKTPDDALQKRFVDLQDELDAQWENFVNAVEQRMASGLTPGKSAPATPEAATPVVAAAKPAPSAIPTPTPTPAAPIAPASSSPKPTPAPATPTPPSPAPGGAAAVIPGIAFIGGSDSRRAGTVMFGRYVLTRIVGRGGMGEIWLAHDQVLEQDVALKFVPEALQYNAKALDELKKETLRARGLQHPGIVQVFDLAMGDQGAAIAMEYVPGETLDSLQLQQPGRVFEPVDLEEMVAQLCAALEYAHRDKKVVHRDLKPANVMLDKAGRVKLLDFGVARSLNDSLSRVSQDKSAGTPYYMSPQQALGERPTAADDIYSLGTTLYELLTGKPPFHTGDIISQVERTVPPSMTARRKELETESGGPIPPVWEETVAACLAKRVEDRPPSARAVAERLGLKRRLTEVKNIPANVPPASVGASNKPPAPATPPPEATQPRPDPKSDRSRRAGIASVAAPRLLVPVCRRFTLADASDQIRVHVLGDDRIRFGRSSDNDVMVRVLTADPQNLRSVNLQISRFHFEIVRQDDRVVIHDGQDDQRLPDGTRRTSSGTFVDGECLDELALQPGTIRRLSLVNPDVTPENAHWDLQLLTCAAMLPGFPASVLATLGPLDPNAPAGVYFRRLDALREDILILWRLANLEILGLEKSFGGLARHQNGFLTASTAGAQPVTDGLRLGAGFRVVTFNRLLASDAAEASG